MTAQRLDGKSASAEIRAELRSRIELLAGRGVKPSLSLIRVGEDPASAVYVRTKEKGCSEVGIESEVLVLPDSCDPASLERAIDDRVGDPRIHGILLQLPLPPGFDTARLLERIAPEKDVDGFHPENIGRLCLGRPGFVPCTPLGIVELLERHGISLAGRHVAIVGRSTTVGRPLANLLSLKGPRYDAAVSIVHSRTSDPQSITLAADIVVAAAGSPRLVTGDWVRVGATVVDVGIHRAPDGRLVGDVDATSVEPKAAWLSPVPGGVGPMTVACLLANTVQAAEAGLVGSP